MPDPRRVDLNLIIVLNVLLTERSIARSAEVLGITPTAVSASLNRLRGVLDDALLVRSGRSFELTERAQAMRSDVAEAALEVDRTFSMRPTFEPLVSDRRFSIAASDYVLATMTSPIFSLLRQEAPGTSIEFTGLIDVDPVDLLRRDVVIAGGGRAVPGKRQELFSDDIVCLVRHDHPMLVDGALSNEALGQLPYVQVVFTDQIVLVADDSLAAAGIVPRVVLTTNGIMTLPFLIADTDMFGFVPARLAEIYAPSLGLIVAHTNLARARLIEDVYWHPSRHSDPALAWLLDVLRRAARIVEFGWSADRRSYPRMPST